MKPESDEALVVSLRNGDLEAFRELYARHKDAMLRLAARILRNRADAEDAVQEAFLVLFRKVGGFRGSSSFATWFYRIVVNASLQILKAQSAAHALRERAVRESPGVAPAPRNPGMREAARILDREIEALPLRQRMVFTLIEVEGFSRGETAGILGLESGTVRYHFSVAKERLRRRLEPLLWPRPAVEIAHRIEKGV